MRILPLTSGLLLATAFLAFATPAEASARTCSSVTDVECPAVLCVDGNGDRRFDWDECVQQHHDPCHYQSDCCAYSGGFWCPETE